MSKNPYACAFCEKSFSSPKALVDHVQIGHAPIEGDHSKIGHSEKRLLLENSHIFFKEHET